MSLNKNEKGLSSFTLKMIAIVAMTIDHIAWGGVEFYSVWGQIMHIIGRLTIPIMCFGIVQGYLHTRNVKNYALRLLVFGVLSAVPFYLFFGSLYGYRQNILVDLLLGLLTLMVVGDERNSRSAKIVSVCGIMIISILIGGWPVLPILYILIFYYFRNDFRKACKWFIAVTFAMVALVIGYSLLNDVVHFTQTHWDWYEKLYLLGFILALPLINLFNGEKGGNSFFSAFFYLYYPIHLLLLALFFKTSPDMHTVLILLQIDAIVLTTVLIVLAAVANKESSNSSIMMMLVFGLIFMVSYLGEIINPSLEAVKEVVKLEYFANCGFIICFTWFISEFLHIGIPSMVYWFEAIVGMVTLVCVYTMNTNMLFYKSFTMGGDLAFPIALVEPGPMYIFFYAFLILVYTGVVVASYIKSRNASFLEHKRILICTHAIISLWFFIALKPLGISKYDMISFGVLSAMGFASYGVIKYGFISNTKMIADTALNHCSECIIVIDMGGEVLMMNDNAKTLFPEMRIGKRIETNERIRSIMEGRSDRTQKDGKIYEFKKDPLVENNIIQGYMIWAVDITDHVEKYNDIKNKAETDGLTKLYNRIYVERTVREALRRYETGTLFMLDLDNFKNVNDHYGHSTGDAVLIAFSEYLCDIFRQYKGTVSRLGGDEFVIYVPDITDRDILTEIADRIISKLQEKMKKSSLPTIIGTSVGICVNEGQEMSFEDFYNKADEALYRSKEEGKNRYSFSGD